MCVDSTTTGKPDNTARAQARLPSPEILYVGMVKWNLSFFFMSTMTERDIIAFGRRARCGGNNKKINKTKQVLGTTVHG